MDEQNIERIRFSIKGPEGTYRGEILGDGLHDNARYSVRMTDGEDFELEAVSRDQDNYNWIAKTKGKIADLAPVVGSIIERYFKRKKKDE